MRLLRLAAVAVLVLAQLVTLVPVPLARSRSAAGRDQDGLGAHQGIGTHDRRVERSSSSLDRRERLMFWELRRTGRDDPDTHRSGRKLQANGKSGDTCDKPCASRIEAGDQPCQVVA